MIVLPSLACSHQQALPASSRQCSPRGRCSSVHDGEDRTDGEVLQPQTGEADHGQTSLWRWRLHHQLQVAAELFSPISSGQGAWRSQQGRRTNGATGKGKGTRMRARRRGAPCSPCAGRGRLRGRRATGRGSQLTPGAGPSLASSSPTRPFSMRPAVDCAHRPT